MSGYTKLFGSIVGSTVWRESLPTKVVWITMLAMSDADGVVEGSIPGLAHLAGVTIEEVEAALETLSKPDKYSRTPDHEGRRIEAIDGGWVILNRIKYRDKDWQEDQSERRKEINRRYYHNRKLRPDSDFNGLNKTDSDSLRDKKEKEKENTTTTSGEVEDVKPSRKRRSRDQILSGYRDETKALVNEIIKVWPDKRPGNNSPIQIDTAMLVSRVDDLLGSKGITPSILRGAAKRYLSEDKPYLHAPEFFFGPGKGDDPPWRPYARLEYHEQQRRSEA